MKATKRHLIGRKIIAVDFQPFDTGIADCPQNTAHDPRLTLDNGRQLYFVVEETEVGGYGITICITENQDG